MILTKFGMLADSASFQTPHKFVALRLIKEQISDETNFRERIGRFDLAANPCVRRWWFATIGIETANFVIGK